VKPPVFVDATTVLEGQIDFDSMLTRYPEADSVKGMFFARRVEMLGGASGLEQISGGLRAPPRLGRYVPFVDYPLRDYMFLLGKTVERHYTRVGSREGLRQLARDDLRIFGESMLGRVMLEVAGDAHAALMATPRAFAAVATGMKLEAESVSSTKVVFTFRHVFGAWEYNLGQLEGIVGHFGEKARCAIFPHSAETNNVLVIEVTIG
jgi:uncharacterized protein (TIGR02265 family)